MLKIHTLPPTGGDTLWASGYEIYDRLSPAMRTMLESLTATHDAKFFLEEAERLGNPLRRDTRGNPLNQGDRLTAVHPVIRTNRKCLPFFNTQRSGTRGLCYRVVSRGATSCLWEATPRWRLLSRAMLPPELFYWPASESAG